MDKDNQTALQTAVGKQKADKVFTNARVVNVYSGEIIKADIAVCGDTIVGVGDYKGEAEIDLGGKTVIPGLIDAHLHLESAAARPEETVLLCAKSGTLGFVIDPHEAANVAGSAGIDFMLDATADLPADVFVMLPSCVPPIPTEDNGGVFDAEMMKKYLGNPRVLGLAEVMDIPAVINGDKRMTDKLRLFSNRIIDGHAGEMSDKEIAACRLAGIETDHECCDIDSAVRQLRAGFWVFIREGSAARNLEALVRGILEKNLPTGRFCFCTDDKHIADIKREGHIIANVRKAVSLGMNPVTAIQMATINPATCYGLKDLGAVAPGKKANFVVVEDLKDFKIKDVYYHGESICETEIKKIPVPAALKKTVNIAKVNASRLQLETSGQKLPVICLIPGQILTEREDVVLPNTEGLFIPDRIYNKVAVFERHKATGRVGVAALKGFGIEDGAIASTVAHDSHNLIVAGDNDRDMLAAVSALIERQGGYVLVKNGKIMNAVGLEIMGLMPMSNNAEFVQSEIARLIKNAHQMGVNADIDPLVTVSFLSLPVIPRIRITTRGIYDAIRSEYIKQSEQLAVKSGQ